MAADVSRVAGDLERGLGRAVGVAGTFGKIMGAGILAGGVTAAFGEVIKTGNDFTNELNTMQAVSSATAQQMAAVSERAKELGNDNQLSATSASDAAAAMTELAKGGFTVEQSMEAARGTLQLAAAAQIDAGTAATIQSQALQAFGLDASYAATAADVLANAANASSAEITDIAAGLQQSGAVANQFGLTVEDTAAALGVLSNAGISGSDAGTLLKSALLAVTDQGKPAQAAIEELGLTIYDAEGQFVGMSSLFGQLDEAAASMTPELYQAATATLFGSDAMRLAGVAAEQGQAGYDAMHTAIERQGAAAEVAAAKTQGLPGAMASIENATETLTLGLYGLIEGPLEGFATAAADKISAVTPGIISGLQDAGGAAVEFGQMLAPVAGFVGDAVGAFLDLPAPVQAVAGALAALQVTGGADKIGSWFQDITENFQSFREEMQGEIDMQAALGSIGENDPFTELTGGADELAGALEENAEPLSELAAGLATLERRHPAIRQMADGYRGVTTATQRFADRQRNLATTSGAVTGALRNGAAQAARFGGVVGGAAVAGANGLVSATKGVVGVLGGPWMVGIMAATAIVGQFSSENAKASQQAQVLQDSSTNLAVAQRDVAKAFQESNGEISDTVMSALAVQIDTVRGELGELADTAPGSFGIFRAGYEDVIGWFSGVAQAGTEAYNKQEETAESAARVKQAFDDLGLSNEELASKLTASNTEFATFEAVLRNSGEGGAEAADKMRLLREEAQRAEQTAKNTTPGFFDMKAAIATLGDEAASADDRVSALKTALDVFLGNEIPLSDAVQAYNDTIRQLGEEQPAGVDPAGGVGDALVGENGAVNTQLANGSALRDSLTEIRDRTIEVTNATITASLAQGKSLPEAQEAARAAIASNADALLGLGNNYQLTKTQIEAMAAAEGLLPEQIIMLASLSGADDVTQQLTVISSMLKGVGQPVDVPVDVLDAEALQKIKDLGGTVETDINGKPGIVRITAPTDDALRQLRDIDLAANNTARNRTVSIDVVLNNIEEVDRRLDAAVRSGVAVRGQTFATGGPITGGVPGKDSVPILAMPGEHMLTVDDVNRLGGQEGVYRFRDALARGEVRGYAGGGAIVDSLTAYVGQKFPALKMTSGYIGREGETGSYHSMGMAADFSNGFGNTDAQLGLATLMASKFGSELKELIYDDPRFGREIKDGEFVDDSFYDGAGDHTNHVHIATDHVLVDPGDEPETEVAPLSERDAIADAIIAEGRRRGITDNGIKAAVMTGLAESDLSLVEGGPDTSTGPFQQQEWWGSYEERMDPTIAAGKFYDRLVEFDYDSMDPADAAQRVQQSAFSDGSNYRERAGEAESIIAALDSRDSSTSLSTSSSSTKKVTWAEKDQIALDRAQVAVTQAQEARDKIYANEKKSQADREQADLKVKAAKQKVIDLQAKKDAAASGAVEGPAPQAPDLAKNFTDEEISLMRAQLAVDQANAKRNEVYADPEATENDRTEADLALASARNALKEEQEKEATGGSSTSSGGSGEGFSVKERLKDFGSQVSSILVDALFEQLPFGIGESRWWDLKVPTFGAEAEAAKRKSSTGDKSRELVPVGASGWVESLFGPAAGGLQNLVENGKYDPSLTAMGLTEDNPLVVTALGSRSLFTGNFDQNTRSTFGVEEDHPAVTTFLENKSLAERPWEQKLADLLDSQRKTPMLLRDTGGRLPHGHAALNLSGEDEWVTTASQRDRQMREIAAVRANNQAGGVATVDTSKMEARIDEMAKAARQPTVVFQTDSVDQGIRAWRSEVNVRSLSFKKRS
ncbi:phage tail tape measure protein [Rhodococcus sp. B10]|uniref:phage tail tape measure protein n=1 Tax=Rhodococcus sp. B10 TaxID=2695876 RepID=UPI003211F081